MSYFHAVLVSFHLIAEETDETPNFGFFVYSILITGRNICVGWCNTGKGRVNQLKRTENSSQRDKKEAQSRKSLITILFSKYKFCHRILTRRCWLCVGSPCLHKKYEIKKKFEK